LKGEEGSTGADGEYQSSPAANSTTGSGSGGTSSGAFPVVQSLDYSCVAAAACNLIYLKTGKVVSEADAMKEIARLGGFSEDLFKTTGINRDQQKAGVIPFLAAHGITAKMSSITGTNLAESNLSSALQSGEPFIVRSSAFMTNPGHALVMQYDSANSNFRVINSAGVQNASGGMDYDYRMTPGEAWDAVKYISHWEAIWNVWSSGLFLKHLEKVPK
jgi:predicted double-glycine peptidase